MMERMTKRTAANGIILTGIFTSATYDTPEEVRQLLADYEDTGLTPEEIKSAFNEDAIIKLCAQALGVSADRSLLSRLIQSTTPTIWRTSSKQNGLKSSMKWSEVYWN